MGWWDGLLLRLVKAFIIPTGGILLTLVMFCFYEVEDPYLQ